MINTYHILPGGATELPKQLPAGTVIINNDSVNAIWISERPNISPNQGYRIGALGSFKWQKTADCWACVDTGVTTGVIITIGDNLDQIVNPVDIAVAVAAKGIPNTLLLDSLYDENIPSLSNSIIRDVSKYATLQFTLNPSAINNAQCIIAVLFQDDSGNNIYPFQSLSVRNSGITKQPVTYTLPVLGPQVTITTMLLTDAVKLNLYGSNRYTPINMQSAANFFPATFIYEGPITAQIPVTLIAEDSDIPFSTFNGSVKGYFVSVGNTALAHGNLKFSFLKHINLSSQIILDTINPDSAITGYDIRLLVDMVHPLSPASWSFYPSITLPSVFLSLRITGM